MNLIWQQSKWKILNDLCKMGAAERCETVLTQKHTHTHAAQTSAAHREVVFLGFEIPATLQGVYNREDKHSLCVTWCYPFDTEVRCVVSPSTLNIKIVRCTWQWFTKLAKSLGKFSDVLFYQNTT